MPKTSDLTRKKDESAVEYLERWLANNKQGYTPTSLSKKIRYSKNYVSSTLYKAKQGDRSNLYSIELLAKLLDELEQGATSWSAAPMRWGVIRDQPMPKDFGNQKEKKEGLELISRNKGENARDFIDRWLRANRHAISMEQLSEKLGKSGGYLSVLKSRAKKKDSGSAETCAILADVLDHASMWETFGWKRFKDRFEKAQKKKGLTPGRTSTSVEDEGLIEKLKAWMQSCGFNRKQTSEQAGVSVTTLSKAINSGKYSEATRAKIIEAMEKEPQAEAYGAVSSSPPRVPKEMNPPNPPPPVDKRDWKPRGHEDRYGWVPREQITQQFNDYVERGEHGAGEIPVRITQLESVRPVLNFSPVLATPQPNKNALDIYTAMWMLGCETLDQLVNLLGMTNYGSTLRALATGHDVGQASHAVMKELQKEVTAFVNTKVGHDLVKERQRELQELLGAIEEKKNKRSQKKVRPSPKKSSSKKRSKAVAPF